MSLKSGSAAEMAASNVLKRPDTVDTTRCFTLKVASEWAGSIFHCVIVVSFLLWFGVIVDYDTKIRPGRRRRIHAGEESGLPQVKNSPYHR